VSWLLQALTNGYYMFFFPVLVARVDRGVHTLANGAGAGGRCARRWGVFSLPLLPVLYEYYTVQRRSACSARAPRCSCSARLGVVLHYSPLLRFWPFYEPRTQEDFLFPGVAAIGV
jgi:hypothetical protein